MAMLDAETLFVDTNVLVYASVVEAPLVTYSPSPSGRGQGEGQTEPRRALAVPRPPYTDLQTAIDA